MTSSWLSVTFQLCFLLQSAAARSVRRPSDDVDEHDWTLTPEHRRHLVTLDGSKLERRHHGDGDADSQPVTSLPAHLGMLVMFTRLQRSS